MVASKRERLLDAAEALFYREGFHATGIDRIVAEAGVVRMTLYNNFRSKDALAAAVLTRRHERFVATVDTAVRGAPAGGATLALADAHGDWVARHGNLGCILIKAMGEYGAHAPSVYATAERCKEALIERIRTALMRDGHSGTGSAPATVFLLLEGSNAAALVLGAHEAVKETRRAIAALVDPAAPPVGFVTGTATG